jgi:hypothetical protein
MSNFISIKITEGVIKKFKFSNEKDMISRLKAVSGIIDYVEFLRYMNHEIATTMQMEKGMHSEPRAAKVDSRDLKISKVLNVKTKMLR